MEAIREAGGEIYAITSEPQSLARNAQEDWATGIEHVGDPHQEIAGACKDRGWLSLFVYDLGTGFAFDELSWASHPKGYFQPGVLALSREGRVLYRWRSRPNRKNVGGAVARPTATHVWERVQAAREEPETAPDALHDDNAVLDSASVPWPVFVSLLIANGWFVTARPFGHRMGRGSPANRIRNAMLRIPLFLAAWVVMFTFLPLWVAGLALAGWVAKIVPVVRTIHERFQNVGPDENPA